MLNTRYNNPTIYKQKGLRYTYFYLGFAPALAQMQTHLTVKRVCTPRNTRLQVLYASGYTMAFVSGNGGAYCPPAQAFNKPTPHNLSKYL